MRVKCVLLVVLVFGASWSSKDVECGLCVVLQTLYQCQTLFSKNSLCLTLHPNVTCIVQFYAREAEDDLDVLLHPRRPFQYRKNL